MRTSYSRLDSWAKCQWGYHLEHDEKILTAWNPYGASGRAIHRTFERAGLAIMDGAALDAETLTAAFDAYWREETALVAPHRAALAPYVTRAHAVIRAFVDQFQPHYRPVEVERAIEMTIGEHSIRGRRDGVVIGKDGRRHVIDFKTGKPWTRPKVAASHQMTLYCLADQDEHGADGATSGSFVFFDGPDDAITVKVMPTDRPPESRAAMIAAIDAVATEMAGAATGGYTLGIRGRSPFPCAYCTVAWACDEGQIHLDRIGAASRMIPILP